ncbi:MAG TPA: SDR family oxidoreductase [Solirubrobacteraceae bacterium]|nr:SDR family oxidoreductase [Solirubrobacteraceae bacterium]
MELGLEGVPCVVTGGSRGIGRAVAAALARERARVLIAGRAEDAARATAGELGVEWLAADVGAAGAAERIVEACAERFGGIQVLVNNAGAMSEIPLHELSDAEWQRQWELSVLGPMRLMRAAAPRMAAAGWGRIVNVSSTAARRPSLANAAYSAAKAAQLSLSRAFADEWSSRGVLVNAVTPGSTASDLWMQPGGLLDQAAARAGEPREAHLRRRLARLPLGRFGLPEEVAAVIAFLCSERAAYVAGSVWSVDGGTAGTIV